MNYASNLARLDAACHAHQRGALLPRDLIKWLDRVPLYGRGTDSDLGRRLAGAVGHDPDVSMSALAAVLADRARRRWAEHDEALRRVKDATKGPRRASSEDLAALRQLDTAEGAAAIRAHDAANASEARVLTDHDQEAKWSGYFAALDRVRAATMNGRPVRAEDIAELRRANTTDALAALAVVDENAADAALNT